MGRKLSIFWGTLILLVLLLLWGREAYLFFYSTSNDNSTSQNNSTASPKIASQNNWINSNVSITLQEPKMNEPQMVKSIHGENLTVNFKKLNLTIYTNGKKNRRIRAVGSEGGKKRVDKIPHAAFQPHTKEEFDDIPEVEIKTTKQTTTKPKRVDVEERAGVVLAAGPLNMTMNDTNSTTISPIGPAGGQVLPEILKRGCIPILKPVAGPAGSPPAAPVPQLLTIYPPCPLEDPPTEEPIPLIRYTGRRQWDVTCIPDDIIATLQLAGLVKYSPADPAKDVESGLEIKRQDVESMTCDRTKGLECIEIPVVTTGTGTTPDRRCRCMAAFGQPTSQRLQIGGKCYIPAGKGQFSDCFDNEAGFPLPTGDTLEWREYNPVILPCVPNAICREHSLWFGKRCACRKGAILQDDGTCDKGLRLFPWKAMIFVSTIFHFCL